MNEKKYNVVLVVDDSETDNAMNTQIISSNSFCNEIKTHTSAKKALEYLKTTSADQLPDVVFLDIVMPEMDGFAFLNEFEQLPEDVHNKCKIILLSSSDSFKDLNRANKNKFVKRFLNKPLTGNMLQAINF